MSKPSPCQPAWNTRIDTGKIIRIVTNDLDATAEQIVSLYKRRWATELFFRWVKQTPKLCHFFGTFENAVRIQVAVALIAFVLIKLAHAAQHAIESLTSFARLIQATILHRRRIERLAGRTANGHDQPVQNNAQGRLLRDLISEPDSRGKLAATRSGCLLWYVPPASGRLVHHYGADPCRLHIRH